MFVVVWVKPKWLVEATKHLTGGKYPDNQRSVAANGAIYHERTTAQQWIDQAHIYERSLSFGSENTYEIRELV